MMEAGKESVDSVNGNREHQTEIREYFERKKHQDALDNHADGDEDSAAGITTIKGMTDYVVNTFDSIVAEKDHLRAINFIQMMPLQKPPCSTLQKFVHVVLMTSTKKETVKEAYAYLVHLLSVYKPCNNKRRDYYRNALFSYFRTQTMWETVHKLINCSFQKCGFEQLGKNAWAAEPHQDNSMQLLKYIVQVIKCDHEEFVSARSVTSRIRDVPPTLISSMLWRNSQPTSTSHSFRQLISCLNEVFSVQDSLLKFELLEILQTLFCVAVSCVFLYTGCTGVEVLKSINCDSFMDLGNAINQCKFITTGVRNLKLFLSGIDLLWLRIKICNCILSDMIYGESHFKERITIRRIVTKYMFPRLQDDSDDDDDDDFFEPSSCKKRKLHGKPDTKQGGHHTPLHECCKHDQPGSLLELLAKDNRDINARDSLQQTPLHIAARHRSHQCVIAMLKAKQEEGSLIKPDVFARDLLGNTPLHIAVKKNALHVACVLLEFKGHELAKVKNEKGRSAYSLARTTKSKPLLKKYKNASSGNKTVKSEQFRRKNRRLPPEVKGPDLAVYVYSVTSLLYNYLEYFGLSNISADESYESICLRVCDRLDHVPTKQDISCTRDDLCILRELDDIMHRFYDLLEDVSAKSDADANEELLCSEFCAFLGFSRK